MLLLRPAIKSSFRLVRNISYSGQFFNYYSLNRLNGVIRSNLCFKRFTYPINYGSTLKEHKHATLIFNLGVTADEQEDNFVDSIKIHEAISPDLNDTNYLGYAIESCIMLKRYKLGFSIIEFMVQNRQFSNLVLLNFLKLISQGYVHQSISFEQAKGVMEKLLPIIKELPPQISSQLMETANIFLDGKKEDDDMVKTNSSIVIPETSLFLSLITHAIRQRDLDEVRKLSSRFHDLSVYNTPVLNEWLKWVEESPSEASELFQLFMNTMANNYYHLSTDFTENFIQHFNKISHLPPFVKVEVGEDRKCHNCSSKFDPKPTFTDEEMAEFSRVLNGYAKQEELPRIEIERLQFCAKKLLKWKKGNSYSFPICLADVPNIVSGKGVYNTNVGRLRIHLNKMLENFSAVGLVSKFPLPIHTTQELTQMKRVVYFKAYKTHYSDDLLLLMMLTECGKDTYIVTNDYFRDHFGNLRTLNPSSPLSKIFSILGSRCLKFNVTTGVLEHPSEISPFVHKTSTGYHLAVRHPIIMNNHNIYEYYCCHKLF